MNQLHRMNITINFRWLRTFGSNPGLIGYDLNVSIITILPEMMDKITDYVLEKTGESQFLKCTSIDENSGSTDPVFRFESVKGYPPESDVEQIAKIWLEAGAKVGME